MIIVFLGPPGSGKGTQAERLREEYGFVHFDTGAQLRAEAGSGSELGQRISSYINEGNLVPLPIIQELVEKFLGNAPADRIMFDGFPRDLAQAGVLDSALARIGRPLDAALYLKIDQNELLGRIVNRRTCPVCGEIYNLKTHAPRADAVCDKDGAALVQRADDNPEKLKRRIEVYLSETVPVLEHYRQQGRLREINADQSIEAVTADIVGALGVLDAPA